MSHNPERKEKNCLNCNTEVHGRYCQQCGQENIETKESFWSLIKHFVYDILHFDGKFFHTFKYLFTKPGLVARQYAEGKRATYLHPIRMYLFTSAIFFLIFFSVKSFSVSRGTLSGNLDNDDRVELAENYKKQLQKKPADTFLKERISLLLDTAKPVNIDSLGWQKVNETFITFDGSGFTSIHQYDTLQASLPDNLKDGWAKKLFTRQGIKANKKYSQSGEGVNSFVQSYVHKLPYLLFVSLPFFALLLKLLYIRRKNFYYSDHSVFTLYHYILSFILLLLLFGVEKLADLTGWRIFNFVMAGLGLSWPVYLYLQMKRFYLQSRLKTAGKFLLLNFLAFFILMLLLIFFALFSIFQV